MKPSILLSIIVLFAAGKLRSQTIEPLLTDVHSNKAVRHDVSAPLSAAVVADTGKRLSPDEDDDEEEGDDSGRIDPSRIGRGISQLQGRISG